MLKNKRINLLLLAIMFISLTLTACSNGPKEKLMKSTLKLTEADSYTQNFKLSMNLNLDEMKTPDMSAAMFLSIINSSTIEAQSKAIVKTGEQSGNLTLNLSEVAYPIDFFATKEKIIFKTPLDERFVKFELPETMDQLSSEEYKALYTEMSDELVKALAVPIADANVVVSKTTKNDIKYETITLNPTSDELLASIKAMYAYMFTDPEMKEIMIDSAINQSTALGETLTKEEAALQLDESYKALIEALDLAKEKVDFTGTTISFDINPEGYTSAMNCIIKMIITDEETGKMVFSYNISNTITDINSTVVAPMPTLTEEQTMTMEELSNLLMGALMGPSLDPDMEIPAVEAPVVVPAVETPVEAPAVETPVEAPAAN